jgi:hypothetical protein
MNWFNLKKNKCPQCNKDFTRGLTVESNMQPTTLKHACGFKIREQKYKEIVSGMVERNLLKNQELYGE